MLESQEPPSIFTATSAVSLAGVLAAYLFASTAARKFLPLNGRWQDKVTFIWLVRMNDCPDADAAKVNCLIRCSTVSSTLSLKPAFFTSQPSVVQSMQAVVRWRKPVRILPSTHTPPLASYFGGNLN